MMEDMYCRICGKKNPLYEIVEHQAEYKCVDCGECSVAPISQHLDRLNDLIALHEDRYEDSDYDEGS